MLRPLLIAAVLSLAACAPRTDPARILDLDEQAGRNAVQEAFSPVWRRDASRLADDLATLDGCFVSALQHNDSIEAPCAGIVADGCRHELGEDAAMTTGGARACAWRELAAWEEVLAEVVGALRGELTGGELAAFADAQAAWEAFLVANVRALSARFEGGSLQGVVAAEERARMVAARAVELRAWRREQRL